MPRLFRLRLQKAGGLTVSHLRVSEQPINSAYLVSRADFVGCHQLQFIDKYQMVERLKPWHLPAQYPLRRRRGLVAPAAGGQALLHQRQARFYIINAAKLARECRLGARINTVMQMAFFHLTQILPSDVALQQLQDAIARSYSSKGRDRRAQLAGAGCHPRRADRDPAAAGRRQQPNAPAGGLGRRAGLRQNRHRRDARRAGRCAAGFRLPAGRTAGGHHPMGKAQHRRRDPGLAARPVHPVQPLRRRLPALRHSRQGGSAGGDGTRPASLQSLDVKARDMRGQKYVLQVAPEDCTGCNLCVEVCPAKDRQNPEIKAINMASRLDNLTAEKDNYDFLQLPEIDPAQLERIDIRTSQLITPLFEYSGACSGCGETPYIKLLTQLYGDRLLIANATGCSSIYGGNLPTTPYTTNAEGRGPAWANSLFEDNAEFGLGFRLTVDQHRARVLRLLNSLAPQLPDRLVNALQMEDVAPEPRRKQIAEPRALLASLEGADARQLAADADYLVDKSIWLIGGDGWAYDIGFGGLDHVLSLTENVNVLVLDTQCYSNTGGQQSKATPLGAVTKFGEHGKRKARKDLGVSMMMYGHVYVAQISGSAA